MDARLPYQTLSNTNTEEEKKRKQKKNSTPSRFLNDCDANTHFWFSVVHDSLEWNGTHSKKNKVFSKNYSFENGQSIRYLMHSQHIFFSFFFCVCFWGKRSVLTKVYSVNEQRQFWSIYMRFDVIQRHALLQKINYSRDVDTDIQNEWADLCFFSRSYKWKNQDKNETIQWNFLLDNCNSLFCFSLVALDIFKFPYFYDKKFHHRLSQRQVPFDLSSYRILKSNELN